MMKTDSKIARPNKITVTRSRLVISTKIVATSIIWLVFAIGIGESNGNTSEMLTVVVATLAMVGGTLYIWQVDQVQDWLRRKKIK